jgi:cystathionine beta-lyase
VLFRSSNWFKTRYNWNIKASEIVYVDGTVNAVRHSIEAFTNPGEGVLINRPIYTPFTRSIQETNRVVVNSQLIYGDDGIYEIDFEDFERKAAEPNTKMFILCNPHNPTGRIWSNEDLIKLAEICRANGVMIVADEIHGDLIRCDETFTPIATLIGSEGLISCTAANKTFNLAGLKATNLVIADEALREKFVTNLGRMSPNPFTVEATIAAYREGGEWLDQLKVYIDETIDWVLGFLKENLPLVKTVRPQGTYIMWLDFRSYGLSEGEIRDRIYNKANVILEGGSLFDPDLGAGFERICLPSPRSMIIDAFERIAAEF